jgi:drug/metabolite transporter (DMT)-like permease
MVAVFCWSTYPIIMKVAYSHGVEPIDLMGVRLVVAASLLLGYCLLRLKRGDYGSFLDSRHRWDLILQVLTGAATSFCTTYAIAFIDAAAAIMILYLYPAMTNVLSIAYFGEKLGRIRIGSLLLALVGLYLVVNPGQSSLNATGVTLALAGAFTYALSQVYAQKNLDRVHPAAISAYVVLGTLVIVLVLRKPSYLLAPSLPLLWSGASLGLIPTALGFVLGFLGIRCLGASRASIVMTIEPVLTITLAMLILKESLSWTQALGAVSILTGVLALRLESFKCREPVPGGTTRE